MSFGGHLRYFYGHLGTNNPWKMDLDDVFPIENGQFPASQVVYLSVYVHVSTWYIRVYVYHMYKHVYIYICICRNSKIYDIRICIYI